MRESWFRGIPVIWSLPGMAAHRIIDGFSKSFAMTGWRLDTPWRPWVIDANGLASLNTLRARRNLSSAAIEALRIPQTPEGWWRSTQRRDQFVGGLSNPRFRCSAEGAFTRGLHQNTGLSAEKYRSFCRRGRRMAGIAGRPWSAAKNIPLLARQCGNCWRSLDASSAFGSLGAAVLR